MKNNLVKSILLLVAVAGISFGQLDRSKLPGPGPAPAVAFPDYSLMTTNNGIRVLVVENHELPTVNIELLIDRKPVLESEAVGVIGTTGELLRAGTTKRTKDQIDQEIDLIGGNLSAGGTNIYASGLTRHTDKLFELLADITLHPSFPAAELEKILMQTKSGLKYRKTDPNSIVDVVRKKALYGEQHPYGEVQSEESVDKITREKCMQVYSTYFKPNAAIIAVVGDVKPNDIMKLTEMYFGAWSPGKIPSPVYASPKPLEKTAVAFVDRPSSVQSVIRVSQIVPLQRTSPDVMPVSVMNTVLGGGVFRLFINLREKHAYTYGAYSTMGPDELIGQFSASTSVKNQVTDSSIKEIISEIKRIRDEKVGDDELQRAKNYLSGSFVRSLEVANSIADRAIEIERYQLPKDYYKTYLKRLDGVTSADVQRVARQYLTPDNMLLAVVGTAKEVKGKVAQFGQVTMYDEDGRVISEKPSLPVSLTPEQIFDKYLAKTGGKAKWDALKDRTIEFSGKMANFELKAKNVQKAPNKIYSENVIVGMFTQKSGYDGLHGWAVSPQGTLDLTGEQLDALKHEAPMSFYNEYKKFGYKAEVAGTKDIKGKTCYEVRFSDTSGVKVVHYFTRDDFLKVREVSTMKTPRGPIEQVSDLSEYKDYSGFLIPTKLEQSVMGQVMEMKVSNFTVNTGVPDSLFHKPAAAK